MKVKKRDGTLVPVRLDEITDRISFLSEDLDQSVIDPVKITLEVAEKVHDGISTSKLDSFTAEICHSKAIEHPHFNVLASRLIISDHHKNNLIMANMKFSEVCKILYNNLDQLGKRSSLISEELYQMSQEHAETIDNMIDHERDFQLDYFGFKTLYKAYLLRVGNKVIETPQHMFMRVALGLWGKVKTMESYRDERGYICYRQSQILEADFERIKETYELLSTKMFTHATPTLYNAGSNRPQLFSCFLLGIDDNIESIFKVISDVAQISKYAGGIGIHTSSIRGDGSYIRGTNGNADGILPMYRVFNETARYINQGGRRPGSFAMYIEPWHSDVEDFLRCKLNHGDENRRARDLFYALWIPDLFMKRVKENKDWSLMSPSECPGLENVYGKEFEELYEQYEKEGRVVKTINAKDLFESIVTSQIETGTPYMLYKDAVNKKSNQKNLGTIRSSNLCVAPETRILTDIGWYPIQELENNKIKVWNGDQWSDTEVKKTGIQQKLIRVTLSNGSKIDCTEYHKFYIETGTRPADKSRPEQVEAKDLSIGAKLIKHDLPVIHNGQEMKYAYTHGLFCSDGTYCYPYGNREKEARITLYGKKKELLEHLVIRTTSGKETSNGTINVMLPHDIDEKFKVPINYSMDSKLRWFEGVVDGDGTVSRNDSNESLQVTSIHDDYLFNIQLMLQTIGIHSKVTKNKESRKEFLPDGKGNLKEYDCRSTYRLLVSSGDTQKLLELGFSPKRLQIQQRVIQRDAKQFIKVVSIEDINRTDDTYCFTEPLKNMGMFEGVLIGNCAEICEYSDTDKYACCVLASLVLPSYVGPDTDGSPYVDHQKLYDNVRVITRNLNRVIDVNYYPCPETSNSNFSERPIGIGVQGLQDVFYKLKLPYDSEGALQVDREIHETIYFAALTESCELAKKDGPYGTFEGSPMSQGKFQFDLWAEHNNTEIKHNGRWDWDALRNEVMTHGVRNSLVTALMPTASTSQIMGSTAEAFEPLTSNCYTRRIKAGEFLCLNKYMAQDLIDEGLWGEGMRNSLLQSRGSLKPLDIPQKFKDLYKTVWELKQKSLIDHSLARGIYVDQSQSLNLYYEESPSLPPLRDRIAAGHFYGWSKGLKTGCYYTRSKPAVNSVSFTMEHDESDDEVDNEVDEVTESYDEEDDCSVCGA